MKTIQIDIVSDVMCPWCAVGYYNLKQALNQLAGEVKAHVRWHPFELNPNAKAEGEDMLEHLISKYGMTAEESRANRKLISERGQAAGFRFDFIDGMRMWNTFNAHQLLHWAGLTAGEKQTDLKLALFKAHFQQHQNVSDIEVLADLAAQVGLDGTAAKHILLEQKYAQAVRQEESKWQQAGIRSVPAFIFQQQHLVSGGQPPEAFVDVLQRLAAA